MAYISDDPKPMRRNCLHEYADEGVGVETKVPQVGHNENPVGSENQIRSELPGIECGAIPPTRAGDDEPRPPRPSEDALKRILAEREKDRKEILDKNAAVADNGDVPLSEPVEMKARGRSVKNLIIYSCALLSGLWVFNILYSTIRNVLVAQTNGELALAIILLSATVGVFAFIIIYAWSLFAGLPHVDSVSEGDFHANTYKLMEKIRGDYLSCIPPHEEYARILRMPITCDLASSLKVLRSREYADSKSFLADFKEFQGLQDGQAFAVMKKYILLIAVKTAASPWRIVDMLAVFFNSTLMICEIASIYNRRVSRAHAFRLMMGWMMNLYVSGEIGRVMDDVTDTLNNDLGDLMGADGLGVVVQPFLPLFSKFVGKAAEGGVNAYLAYRLGRRSVLAFRYLK